MVSAKVRFRRQSIAWLCLWGALLVPRTARSFHTEDDRQTDFSAFTLRRNQLRLGLFQQEAGIANWWTIGTYTAPWLMIPFTGAFNGSIYTKLKFVDLHGFAASLRANYFIFNLRDVSAGDLEDGNFHASVLPLSATASYVVNPVWTQSLDVTWVETIAHGSGGVKENSAVFGAGLQRTLQLTASAELRLSRIVALNLLARYVPWAQAVSFSSDSTAADGTRVWVEGEIAGEDLRNSWMLQMGTTFSWARFNLQLGIGYGDFFVPGIRFVGASKAPIPDFDFFFRF
ncbi:MAG TPA: hypothetical protein VN764_03015 [Polyangiaceae bacterium]|nr:hypothetical protein [Polyangiaceae bacterium]